ncbi:MAG: tRNA (adenosine(37)-N6)-dimethylallyltransferase MiaA [Dehalococcoidales bacterium]|nr:tRNA (adenosine(37)-N6)-dimethylallyltransferase MiaA [Dehalococcoidales bacterium]
MKKIIAIIGPTGIGKSNLAVRLCQKIDAEIVSADSRQVYRFMDIGTAKPDKNEQSMVRHHLIDIINPDEAFSLAEYQSQCKDAIDDIYSRKKLSLLAGGSGQYVWAVAEGWDIPKVMPDLEYREMLEKKAAENGAEELYRELQSVDTEAAARIDASNVRRVIRALEIANANDNKLRQRNKKPVYDALIIGLTTCRDELYRRIDARVDSMVEKGLVDEVQGLFDKGYNPDLQSMSGIGYKQVGMFLNGEISLESAIQQIKYETHRYVRSQYNWFKLKDDRIKWFDVQNDIESDIMKAIDSFIYQD